MSEAQNIAEALRILAELGLPRGQQNERSALCLLALLDLKPGQSWQEAGSPLIGVTPIMDFARAHYGRSYAPNTRETFRRQSIHQFLQAGLVLLNPDEPTRPINSPKTVYQIAPSTLALLKTYGTAQWATNLQDHQSQRPGLALRYARERQQSLIPVQIAPGAAIHISPGEHSMLLKAIVEDFCPRFVPGCRVIYVGDTGEKWGYFNSQALSDLGVRVDAHGKMPDVMVYDAPRNWLVLVESVTSHGPMDSKRHQELAELFAASSAGLVYVTAFPTRAAMKRFLGEIAWETEVWVADAPAHLIHFNGERFLGPF